MDTFCERTITKRKVSGKKSGAGEERKEKKESTFFSRGSFSCKLAANQLLNDMPKIRWWIIGNEIFVPGKPTAKILLISMGQGCLSGLNSQSCRIGNSVWTSLFVIRPRKSVLVCFICTCGQCTSTFFFGMEVQISRVGSIFQPKTHELELCSFSQAFQSPFSPWKAWAASPLMGVLCLQAEGN